LVSLKQQLKIVQRFDIEAVKFFAAQILLALENLHENGLQYRAFSLSKILIDHNGYIQLLRPLKSEQFLFDFQYFAYYLAPEILGPQKIEDESFAADLWSFGVVIYELLTGETPFYASTKHQVVENILNVEINWGSRLELDDASSFLSLLLNKNPLQRPNCQVLKQHEFFKNTNWNGLIQQDIDSPFKPRMENECMDFETSNVLSDAEEDWMGLEFSQCLNENR